MTREEMNSLKPGDTVRMREFPHNDVGNQGQMATWEVEVASLEDPTPEQIAQIKADWQKRHQQVLESGGRQQVKSMCHDCPNSAVPAQGLYPGQP